MLGIHIPRGRKARDEAEKPFWISFSDMMSALMVLFLVVMSVALLAVTRKISEEQAEESARSEDIMAFANDLQQVATQYPGMSVTGTTIDFGPIGRFGNSQNSLSSEQRQRVLDFTPKLIERLRQSAAGRKWLKRVVVEGYASQLGSYLFNLNLSLERSERVLCELQHAQGSGALSLDDRMLVAQKFIVGGASFNHMLQDEAASRRIEFKVEFMTRAERKAAAQEPPLGKTDDPVLMQSLSTSEPCPIKTR